MKVNLVPGGSPEPNNARPEYSLGSNTAFLKDLYSGVLNLLRFGLLGRPSGYLVLMRCISSGLRSPIVSDHPFFKSFVINSIRYDVGDAKSLNVRIRARRSTGCRGDLAVLVLAKSFLFSYLEITFKLFQFYALEQLL